MSLSSAQRNAFDKRLSRIRKGGDNTMGEIHIGPRDENAARKGEAQNTVRIKRKKSKVKVGEGSNLVLIPIAVLIGGLSVFAGRAAGFHFFEPGGLMPLELPVEMLVPYTPFAYLVFATTLALIFSWTFGLSGLMRKLAVIAGFGGMLYFEAQMIEQFPTTYANFFSKEFVAEALANKV